MMSKRTRLAFRLLGRILIDRQRNQSELAQGIGGLLMKKYLRITTLLLCGLLLAGCANPGGAGPKTDTPAAQQTIALEQSTPVPRAETPVPTDACPVTDAPGEPVASDDAAQVRMTRSDGAGEKVLFEGLDKNGAVVWQRTETTEHRTELTLIEEIGSWNDRYYYNRQGTVCCLRLSDGDLLWENSEFGGASISGLIDQRNGSVYLCGWYGPDFFACSKDGDTLSLFESASGKEFYWPSDMAWTGSDRLVIYWQGGAGLEMSLPYYVDLTDFTLSYDFGYIDMDAKRQYWANIFISDFAEQFKNQFPTDQGSDFELASFAHLFCKINRHSALSYDGNYDTFTLDTVNELCMRFFGREIHPKNGVLYENQGGLQWTYENGKFRFPSGDGESYNRFAVVNSYLSLPGGNVILGYDVYELDLDEYWKNGMDSALYRMTPVQAKAAEASGRITRVCCGWAEATPVQQNGHDGYYLRRMETTMC